MNMHEMELGRRLERAEAEWAALIGQTAADLEQARRDLADYERRVYRHGA